MLFKRNVKGLVEREMHLSQPSSESTSSSGFVGNNPNMNSSNSIAYGFAPRAAPNSTHERSQPAELVARPNELTYPQEDFPNCHSSLNSNSLQESGCSQEVISKSVEDDEPETTLGEGVSFKGELAFKRYLCIHGEFEGKLISDGKLRVGKTGVIKSNLHLSSAIIEGRVDGDITVEHLLELRGSARVFGNITAKYLRVDDGVTLMGHVNINPQGVGVCNIDPNEKDQVEDVESN